jgi:hypothetical protein
MSDTEYTKAFKAGYDFGYKDAANENRYNTGVKVGINAERERIIKLIKSQITPCLCEQDCMADDNPAYQELIELIKGEKQDEFTKRNY